MKTFNEFINESKKQLRVLRTAHYTTPENKKKILQQGFKPGSTGAYHPRDDEYNYKTVYTTPSSRIGNEYGRARVNLKIVNPKIKSTTSKSEYKEKVKSLSKTYSGDDLTNRARKLSPHVQSAEAIKKGEKVVRVPDAHYDMKGSYIMVDKDLANKSIDKNPRQTIRNPNKPRRRTSFKKFIESVEKISLAWERKHPGMKLDLSHSKNPESIRVNSLKVPKQERNKGIGSRAMKGVINYAKKKNIPVSLNPSPERGKKQALDRFYKRLGFKKNSGRQRDFRFSDRLIHGN